MNNPDEGATVAPTSQNAGTSECMGRFQHYGQWFWKNGQMTDFVRCTTCGMHRKQFTDRWFDPAPELAFTPPNAREAFMAGAKAHLDDNAVPIA